MSNPINPQRIPPSPWAVALFVVSSAFAALSIALFSTNYSPL
jgi:hypothetical protein